MKAYALMIVAVGVVSVASLAMAQQGLPIGGIQPGVHLNCMDGCLPGTVELFPVPNVIAVSPPKAAPAARHVTGATSRPAETPRAVPHAPILVPPGGAALPPTPAPEAAGRSPQGFALLSANPSVAAPPAVIRTRYATGAEPGAGLYGTPAQTYPTEEYLPPAPVPFPYYYSGYTRFRMAALGIAGLNIGGGPIGGGPIGGGPVLSGRTGGGPVVGGRIMSSGY
jgi:hypothetical protein